MSKPISITGSETLNPSGYDETTAATYSTSGINNGYSNSSSTTYAQINLTRGSQAVTNFEFTFSLGAGTIPSAATITSVTCTTKCSISNTSSSRVATRTAQLYCETTAMGTASNVSTSTTEFDISGGSWTVAQLYKDIRLKLYAVRGTSSTSTSYYFRFYGADLTISYSYSGVQYELIASSTADGVTITPASTDVMPGESVYFTIAGAESSDDIVVTDNNTDVTELLTEMTSGNTVLIPESNTSSGFTVSDINNAYTDASDSSYAQLQMSGSTTGTMYLNFQDLNIPAGAVVTGVSCTATFQFNRNGSTSGFTASCQLYAGSTAKGSATTITSSGSSDLAKTTFTLSVGSWSASEINNARLYITATNSARSTVRYLYVYGASLTVTYAVSGKLYVYTLTNISTDHTIVVDESVRNKIFIKIGGSWVAVKKVYVKTNGTWVLQDDLTNVFHSGYHYVEGS